MKIVYRAIFLSLFVSVFFSLFTYQLARGERQSGNTAVFQAIDTEGNIIDPVDKIDPRVLKALETTNQADFFVWMTEKADLSSAYRLLTKEEKGAFVLNALKATADSSQSDLRAYLDSQSISYRPYFIANKILIRRGTTALTNILAARSDIAKITPNQTYQIIKPEDTQKTIQGVNGVEGNITFVNADDVWALGFTGQGVVLASIDTGLDWEHPALLNQYRGWNGTTANHNYNWWDATGTYPTEPGDGFGHGTHVSGTMVGNDGGDNQIGMAPGAKTIHCKGLDDFGSGDDNTLSTCFEFFLAPWDLNGQNPDPNMAPHAITNSWGYWNGGYPAFTDEIAALQAAGILVEVSAGNEGPSCQTLRSPGDYAEVMTTGSVGWTSGSLPGSLSWFSSRGPSTLASDFLPDIMAPGESIRSSVPGGGYESWDGTSMAGPHVTGLVGLLWAANPGLRGLVEETIQIIQMTASPLTGQTGSNCGGDYGIGPNHDWGYGTIDALAAVNTALAFGGPGTLSGVVTDSSHFFSLEGVQIKAELTPDLIWQTTTNASGLYNRVVFSGTYSVNASLYGYYPKTTTGVVVLEDETTTLNFALDTAPVYTVTGEVTDAVTGWPLYARIDVVGYPFGPVWTDPVTGQYTANLAAGQPYTFVVTPFTPGYPTAFREVAPLTGVQTEDFSMAADSLVCEAPGYLPDFVYFEDFEGSDGGYVVEGDFTSWAWGSPTSGPRSAHTGQSAWATNLSGNYFDNEFGTLTSPEIDMSAFAGQTLILSWWQFLQTEGFYDYASVEASNDGGSSWSAVYGPIDGQVDTVWTKKILVLDPGYAVSNLQLRFVLQTDSSVTFPGFYVDDVGIGVALTPPNLYNQTFEASDGGYTPSGVNSWEWGTPTRGPVGAHSGSSAWGTDLDDNYGNNENGTLTSPVLDLSAGAGNDLVLTWWHWLQTESGYDVASVEATSDGISWFELFNASGIITTDWQEFTVILEPFYATADFQIRFNLSSDNTVTYPGFYIDDMRIDVYSENPLNVACNPQAGGLVVGNVFDGNTGTGLNGAGVASTSAVAYSRPTPADPAVEDGFFTLFGEAGPQTITATLGNGYGSDEQNPIIPLGGAVRQDFNLTAGMLSGAPNPMEVTLTMGSITNQTLTLTNNGGLETAFDLRERGLGFTPLGPRSTGTGHWISQATEGVQTRMNDLNPAATTFAYPSSYRWEAEGFGREETLNILVYADDWVHFPPFSLVDQALQYLGQSYNAHYDADFSGFESDLNSGAWDLVIFANDSWGPPESTFNALNAYVSNGGKLIFHSWAVGFLPGNPLWDSLGISWVNDNYEPPAPVHWWDPAHPAFTYPLEVPEFTQLDGYIYGTYGQYVDPLGGAVAVAGYTTPGPDDGQAALIIGNDGNTVFRGFLDGQNSADLDFDGMFDGAELWVNLIEGIQIGFAQDVLWLSTDVVTGTIPAGGNQLIEVTFNAGAEDVLQPGSYTANLVLNDDSPYKPSPVSVMMNVTAPAGWGRLSGIITGLGVCDGLGAPIYQANIEIEGIASTISDINGSYVYWVPEGTYTVNYSAEGHISKTFSVTVTAGDAHILDVDLRLDAPCTSLSPDTLNVFVPQETILTQALTIDNAGGGTLDFTILESVFDFGASTVAPALPITQVGASAENMQTGPTSVLPLKELSGGSGNGPSPFSGWFGALDHPEGAIRYGFAQCAEQQESFYVFGGIGSTFNVSKKAWRYDAAINNWTRLADMPASGEAPSATCYQGRIYLLGGSGSSDHFVYDIVGDVWMVAASSPRGVEGGAVAAWNGKVFLVGGDDDFSPQTGVSDEVNIYDIASNTWIGTGSPMPFASGNAGYVQTGPYLYVVGGWGLNAPDANVSATQRYNLKMDSWELGPVFNGPRADFALAATEGALYAIGGDRDGQGFFEAVKNVERLDLNGWPSGQWTDTADPLPVPLQANPAGACTEALSNGSDAEVWSVGGLDTTYWTVTGRTLFREGAGESCYSIYSDVSWLSNSSPTGSLPGNSSSNIEVFMDATGLDLGVYSATIVIVTNDSTRTQILIPVTMTVIPPQTHWIYMPLMNTGE